MFSPVVKPTTIRVILSLVTSHQWPLHQLDVNNAFLHGDLQEYVYMSQPLGFVDSTHPNHMCLLKKPLYGLKQAPPAWFQKLASSLADLSFVASQSDPSLFICHNSTYLTLVLVYIDDIIVTSSNKALVDTLISSLATRFPLKDLGSLHYFLGLQVTSNTDVLHLSQPKYIRDILVRTKMDDTKSCNTPIVLEQSPSKFHGTPIQDPHLYRSTVGALQYATITRLDISFVVNKASQFMHSPTEEH